MIKKWILKLFLATGFALLFFGILRVQSAMIEQIVEGVETIITCGIIIIAFAMASVFIANTFKNEKNQGGIE